MINDDLIKYIETQKGRGITREGISKKLSDAGWSAEDINQGLGKVFIETEVKSVPAASPVVAVAPEALIPNLMPKVIGPAGAVPIKKFELSTDLNSNQKASPDPRSSAFDTFRPEQNPQPMPTGTVMSPGPLPSGAVTASYRKEYQNLETISGEPKRHFGRFILIIILILILLGGGVVFASIKGYIQLPFEIPFIKPKPEVAMAKMMGNLSKMQTAHFDTDINFSLATTTTYKEIPVTNGLLTDTTNPENSTHMVKPEDEKNEFNLKISALTDYDNTDLSSLKSDTKIHLEFPADFFGVGELDSEFIFIGEAGYIKLPDLSFIKEFAGDTQWVYLDKADLGNQDIMAPVEAVASLVGTYDLQKQKKLKALFTDTDFIGEIVEVGTEQIENDATYHYQVVIGKDNIKSFAKKAIDIMDDPDMISEREDILNSLDDMKDIEVDVWVTKGTYLLRKIAIVFSNESIDTHDSYETKSKITVVMTQLISKVNEQVEISIPTGAKTIKEIQTAYDSRPEAKDSELKYAISSIRAEAELFFDEHKNTYGKANPTGSCVTPAKDSLFTGVSNLASVLQATNNVASCYSTAKAYAISAPLFSDPTTMFCIDSKGTAQETKIPLTGTVCK